MPLSAIFLAAALTQTQTPPPITYKTQTETQKNRFDLKLVWPVFNESTPLNDFANKVSPEPIRDFESGFKNSLKEYTETPTMAWDLTMVGTVSYYSPNIISIFYDHYEFTGGAHPNSFTHAINVGLINNKPKRIVLKDLLAPGITESDILDKLVHPRLNKIREDRVGEAVEALPVATNREFVISKNGLTFVFDRYAVGAYVEGEYIVKLKWSDLKGLINKEVIPSAVQ